MLQLQTQIRSAGTKPGQPATVPLGLKAQTLAPGLKPGQVLAKAAIARPVSSVPGLHGAAPSILLKAVTANKDREKKSYSSSGYT